MSNATPNAPSWLLNRRETDPVIEWVESSTALAAFEDTEIFVVGVFDGTSARFYRDMSLINPAATSSEPQVVVGVTGRTWRLMEFPCDCSTFIEQPELT